MAAHMLPRALSVLIMLTVVVYEVSSQNDGWEIFFNKNSQTVGDIRVHFNPPFVERGRMKRSSDIIDWLPQTLEMTFSTGDDDVILSLKKSELSKWSPPMFIVRNGKLQRKKSDRSKSKVTLYQDSDNGASVLVSRDKETGQFHVTGTFFHNGIEYSIRPIKVENGNDVDHRIARLFQDVNLQNDLKELDTAIMDAIKLETKEDGMDPNESSEQPQRKDTTVADVTVSVVEKIVISEEILQENLTTNNEQDGNRTDDSSDMANKGVDNMDEKDEDDDDDVKRINKEDEEERSGKNGRKKRQAKNYVVELLIVIDFGVYEIWYQGVTDLEGEPKREEALRRIKQFYSFVLNGIDLRYSSVSRLADFTMDVTWAGIVIFDSPVPDYWANTEEPPKSSRDFVESSAALEAFRAWAESQGADLPPSDHVMLFTGHNLTYGGSVSNAGLAYLGSACSQDYFYSIVEEYFEFRDVAIAAHELGHSLGARHDMDGNTCLSFDRYIMTSRFKFPSMRKAQNPWLFSQCSVDYFTDFIQGLDRNDTNCLVTKDAETTSQEIQPFLVSLPGEVYGGDDFCKLGDGSESFICRDQHIGDYQNVCYAGIYCYRPEDKTCVRKLPPEGFSCGNKKWCINGTCTESAMAPATISDDCPFGDDAGLIGGKTCADRMLTSRFDCYRDSFRAKCCASCNKYKRNLPGCEYGDMFELCKADQCANYDEEYARENCCDTCAELLFTIPSTIATTTTTTTTTMASTSVKSGISGGGNESVTNDRDGDKDDDGNRSNPKDASGEEVTSQDGADGRGQGEGRRRYRGSEESDESGERPSKRRYHGRNDAGYGIRNIASQRYRERTNDRLSQMRNLLVSMRDGRDLSRPQRMRLLLYVLDRTPNEALADLVAGVMGTTDQSSPSLRYWTSRYRSDDGQGTVDNFRDRFYDRYGTDGQNVYNNRYRSDNRYGYDRRTANRLSPNTGGTGNRGRSRSRGGDTGDDSMYSGSSESDEDRR